ncbi:Ankyrin repeat protein 1 [Giardia duodenalis]|uniref:Ankyrin repeat protein 1 n=1 Tax=Giardia intestinalis (strain ATCC 50803 / WB clone C6) TaxID=184922 RepID=A8B820_GIAIC|nr:Ankyrin repeat protein 1 [Giardia intestinalis]KAE8305355.1 Ankyrin repeat protein 1 [Giardia intestinalis]|eukprot:XP_001708927.1 Protein 21.1 [Giardia lamblia ATCC 50803]
MVVSTQSDWFRAIAQKNYGEISAASAAFSKSVDQEGNTGLMIAASNNDAEMCRMLGPLEKGMFNRHGENAITIAIKKRALDSVPVLAQFEAFYRLRDDSTPLHYAVRNLFPESIPFLVHYLKDKPDGRGMTALDLAADQGNAVACETILKYGVGWTPLQLERAAEHANLHSYHTVANLIRDYKMDSTLATKLAVDAAVIRNSIVGSTLNPLAAVDPVTASIENAVLSSRITDEIARTGHSSTLDAVTASKLIPPSLATASAITASQLATRAALATTPYYNPVAAQAAATQAALTASQLYNPLVPGSATVATAAANAAATAAVQDTLVRSAVANNVLAAQRIYDPLWFQPSLAATASFVAANRINQALTESARIRANAALHAANAAAAAATDKSAAVASLKATLDELAESTPEAAAINSITASMRAENYVLDSATGRYPNGDTELINAAKNGNLNSVRILLNTQAGLINNRGKTALICAAERNHIACVCELSPKESGMSDYEGMTALMYGASYGLREVVTALLHPEKRLSRPRDGGTAMMAAAANGHFDCVKVLLDHEHGMQSLDGTTALILAVKFNRRHVAQLLYSTEYDIKDSMGKSARDWATELNRNAILEDMKEYERARS